MENATAPSGNYRPLNSMFIDASGYSTVHHPVEMASNRTRSPVSLVNGTIAHKIHTAPAGVPATADGFSSALFTADMGQGMDALPHKHLIICKRTNRLLLAVTGRPLEDEYGSTSLARLLAHPDVQNQILQDPDTYLTALLVAVDSVEKRGRRGFARRAFRFLKNGQRFTMEDLHKPEGRAATNSASNTARNNRAGCCEMRTKRTRPTSTGDATSARASLLKRNRSGQRCTTDVDVASAEDWRTGGVLPMEDDSNLYHQYPTMATINKEEVLDDTLMLGNMALHTSFVSAIPQTVYAAPRKVVMVDRATSPMQFHDTPAPAWPMQPATHPAHARSCCCCGQPWPAQLADLSAVQQHHLVHTSAHASPNLPAVASESTMNATILAVADSGTPLSERECLISTGTLSCPGNDNVGQIVMSPASGDAGQSIRQRHELSSADTSAVASPLMAAILSPEAQPQCTADPPLMLRALSHSSSTDNAANMLVNFSLPPPNAPVPTPNSLVDQPAFPSPSSYTAAQWLANEAGISHVDAAAAGPSATIEVAVDTSSIPLAQLYPQQLPSMEIHATQPSVNSDASRPGGPTTTTTATTATVELSADATALQSSHPSLKTSNTTAATASTSNSCLTLMEVMAQLLAPTQPGPEVITGAAQLSIPNLLSGAKPAAIAPTLNAGNAAATATAFPFSFPYALQPHPQRQLHCSSSLRPPPALSLWSSMAGAGQSSTGQLPDTYGNTLDLWNAFISSNTPLDHAASPSMGGVSDEQSAQRAATNQAMSDAATFATFAAPPRLA